MGRIWFRCTPARTPFTPTRDVMVVIGRWIYISTSGYSPFDADVRDLPAQALKTHSPSKPIFSYDPANFPLVELSQYDPLSKGRGLK